MRMRIRAAAIIGIALVLLGGMLGTGMTPAWVAMPAGDTQSAGLVLAATGLFQLARRRPKVRIVSA